LIRDVKHICFGFPTCASGLDEGCKDVDGDDSFRNVEEDEETIYVT
jgi:hypothetical protein